MKGRRKRRLVTGILCLAVLVADVGPIGLRVMASEAGLEESAISVDSERKDTDIEYTASLTEGESGTGYVANPVDGCSGDSDENNLSEGNGGGTGSESEATEGNDGTGNENDSPETGDSVGGESGSAGDSDEKQEGDGTQGGESALGETENAGDESGEGTDVEESGEDAVEETVSENTVVASEELEGGAETAALETQAVTASGKCGDNLKWELVDGTLTISGTGEMYDYKYGKEAPWKAYSDSMNKLVIEFGVMCIGFDAFSGCKGFSGNLMIPESVTSIEPFAFEGCSGFTGSLTIPDSIKNIGYDAFARCKGFTGDLIIGNNVMNIENYAFTGCDGFTGNLIIGNNVLTIGQGAFEDCSGFTGSLLIPDSVSNIENRAFIHCSGFTDNLIIGKGIARIDELTFYGCKGFTGNLIIGDNIKHIANSAFEFCGFTGDLKIPNSVESIGSSAFSKCGFTGNLIIGDNVTNIGVGAFGSCSSLTGNLTIPNNVIEIGSGAFSYCSGLTGSLTIGDNVTSIGSGAFKECDFTGELIIPDKMEEIGDESFLKCDGFTGNLIIGQNVKKICGGAFDGCSGFTGSLVIPDSVTEIGKVAFSGCSGFTGELKIGNNVKNIGDFAFSSCDGFTGNLTIGNNVLNIGQGAFEDCRGFTGSLVIPDSVKNIQEWAFRGCSGFTDNLTIGNGLTRIEAETFKGCAGFTGSLTIGNNVTEIEREAFYRCGVFTGDLIIPNSVENIGDDAFVLGGCTGDLIIGDNVKNIGNNAFNSCQGFTGELVIGRNVSTIGENAFNECRGFTGELKIGNNVTSIGSGAFCGCSGLAGSLTIPDSVTDIGSYAFQDCSGFTGNLKISNNVTSIEEHVFVRCSGFTGRLVIPDKVTTIGEAAFYGCSGFTGSLVIPSQVTAIEESAFEYCSGFTGSLIIPSSMTEIEPYVFRGCSGFTGSLEIPNSVMGIGWNAFEGCKSFNDLVIPSSVSSIGGGAFKDCTGLTGSLTIPNNVGSIGNNAFGPFTPSKKVYWHCTLNSTNDCINGGTVIYDDDVPEPTYLKRCTLIKRSDYEASEGDFPSDIQVPSDKAAVGAIDSDTGRLIRSAYIILDGQTYRTDVEGVYYFSLGQNSAARRLVGATADGYLRANAASMSVQHGKLATVSMTKIVSDPAVGDDDVQVPVGKFAICVVDDNQKLIKNAVVEIDGDKIAVPDGVYYADADSKSHYVSASAKGYGGYISNPVTFQSGEKFSVLLRYNDDYNVTYQVGKLKSADDVFTQKISMESGEYSTTDDFDFTKATSLLGKTVVLRMRDSVAVEIYTLEECVAVLISITPDMSSFIYQDGRFSTDSTAVHVSVHYTIRDGFPKNLANIMPQAEKPKFDMKNIKLTIDEGMKVRVGKEEGNALVSNVSKILSVGETYSFDASVRLASKAKPQQPVPSYKMAVEVSGQGLSAKEFQTFHVADADYRKEQTDKRPTTQGSDVSKASVEELLDANILFNIRGTVLEEQYFSEEQIQAVEKMLTLWVVNIDAATDTAREISSQEQFVMDVLNQLKVNIKPYVGVSDTTAQMRIIAETKNYGKRTFIFTLNLKNYRWDDKAPFARFGTVEWNIENVDGIPENYQHRICTMVTKANADRFLNQLKDLAYDSIKNVYKKAWGNKANKVADMMIDKRILDVVNQEFGSVSDMCFKLMIQPTETYVKKGGRKKTTTRCPVDLYVYDSQGNIAGAIIDDIAYPMDDGVLVYVEDGAKIVDYYADEYTVKFVGNDTGTMSHEVSEYYSTGELIRQIEFKDIPLNDGKVYQETIPDFFFAPPEVYALEGEGQEMMHPDTDSYDEERPEIVLVNGISVIPETVTLKIEEEKTLEAVITPTEASLKLVEWSSDNENVVTVSEEGTVKAIGVGTAKVKVVSVDGRYEAECTVTVDISGSEEPENPENPDDPDNPDKPEDPEKPGQGDVLDEDMPQGGINNIPKGLWISEVKPQAYTGKGIKPEVRVYDYKTLLQVKKDYTISYKNNTKANDAQTAKNAPTITVTGKGNYSGKETQTFQILPKDIADDDIVADDIVLRSNKKLQKPVPTMVWNGKRLANKRDFSVSYTDTTNGAYKECGTYAILLTGTGNYTGNRRIALTITEGRLASKLSVSRIADQTYTGSEIKPALTVKDGKTLLTENVHYTVDYQNNMDVGTATVLLNGIGDYIGTKRISFKIKAVASLKNAKVSLTDVNGQKYAGGIYSGEEITPDSYTLTVTAMGADRKSTICTLKEGVDYQVSYKNHIQAGTASIQFSGINGYAGSIKKVYKIQPYQFETDEDQGGGIEVALNQSYSYVKGGCKPKPVITFNGRELQEKIDYTLSYKNNTKLNDRSSAARLPTVVIKGKGNFKGKIERTYSIAPADINRLSLTATDKVWQNKGNIYKTKVVIKDIDNKALSAGRDYDKNLVYTYHEDTQFADGTAKTAGTAISSKDIIPAGTAIGVTVNAKGPNYYGSIYGIYRIAKVDIGKAAVKIPTQIYTGKAIKPDDEIEIKLNRKLLSKENYEIVSYNNNINRGTATVTIRGKNDCGGTKTVKFSIRSKGFLWWWRN